LPSGVRRGPVVGSRRRRRSCLDHSLDSDISVLATLEVNRVHCTVSTVFDLQCGELSYVAVIVSSGLFVATLDMAML